ncbi:hypothetical protein ANN_26128 [Periplaneta americana]|uniref:DDE-1 domain-containing protein n=1 Tax=Periplaneta americana TaxID=6978 RepID=A0ABQ8S5E8_PERAM|nr:hypothetical protein ANN_26128 [Periplaneta americana]
MIGGEGHMVEVDEVKFGRRILQIIKGTVSSSLGRLKTMSSPDQENNLTERPSPAEEKMKDTFKDQAWLDHEKRLLKWMKGFVDKVNPCEKSPVLLIVDWHASHKDLDVVVYAKKHHHVHMLSLPPHTTHKLQSLDRVVMKPFKNAYNEACFLLMRKYPNLKIGLEDIAGLVNSALTSVCRMELAQLAFACTGIYPFNRNVFSDLDFMHPCLNLHEILFQPHHPSHLGAFNLDRRIYTNHPLQNSQDQQGLTTEETIAILEEEYNLLNAFVLIGSPKDSYLSGSDSGDEDDVARAVALYDDGRSVRYIANVMNMARSTTHDAIKRYRETLIPEDQVRVVQELQIQMKTGIWC